MNDVLESQLGKSTPGGCDHCNATQTLAKLEGIYLLTIGHEQTCPWQGGN